MEFAFRTQGHLTHEGLQSMKSIDLLYEDLQNAPSLLSRSGSTVRQRTSVCG